MKLKIGNYGSSMLFDVLAWTLWAFSNIKNRSSSRFKSQSLKKSLPTRLSEGLLPDPRFLIVSSYDQEVRSRFFYKNMNPIHEDSTLFSALAPQRFHL